jgi:hypothetical protein
MEPCLGALRCNIHTGVRRARLYLFPKMVIQLCCHRYARTPDIFCRSYYSPSEQVKEIFVAETGVLSCRPIIVGLERDLGISIDTISLALGVDRRTIERWRANQTVPQSQTRERLGDLVALRDQLARVFETPEVAQAWLRSSSRYLGGITREEALRAGRLDRVRAALEGLLAGVYL